MTATYLLDRGAERRAAEFSTGETYPWEFGHQFTMALLQHHVNMTIFASAPHRLSDMIAAAWADPVIQGNWSDPDAIAAAVAQNYTYPNVTPAIADALFNVASESPMLTMGLGLLQESGRSLTTAQQDYLGQDPLIASTEQVPNPFGRLTPVSGNDYGQGGMTGISAGYGPVHLGVDYGTPEGTLISAPFAGVVSVLRGVAGYGNKVTLTLKNGYSIVFGHVADGLAQGQVQPGQIIARSGANIGSSSGAVTLVELHAPDGSFLNPHAIFDQIQQGVTFASLEKVLGQGIAGSGITHSAALAAEFPGAREMFAKYFGRQPTDAEIMRVATSGGANQDLKSMEDYVRTLPSHIGGMLVGPYFDLRNAADTISQSYLGHLSTDGIVKELFDKGDTAVSDIKAWYGNHSQTQIDAAQYNAIYAANQPYLKSIYNEKGFDPRWATAQATLAGVGAPVTTDQAQSAAALPIASRRNYLPPGTTPVASAAAPSSSTLDAALAKSWAAAASPTETPAPPVPAAPRETTRRGGPQ